MNASLGLTATIMAWYTTSSTLEGPPGPTELMTIGGVPFNLSPAQAEELRAAIAVSDGVMRLRFATQED